MESSANINHFCRLCHGTDEDEDFQLGGIGQEQEWLHPCRCSGSIKWVHRGCFEAWRGQASYQQRTQCSICSHVYVYSWLRLRPGWFAELPIFYWLLIFMGETIIWELFKHIIAFNYVAAFFKAILFCWFLVLMCGLRLLMRMDMLNNPLLEDFQMDPQLNELAELVDGEQLEVDIGLHPLLASIHKSYLDFASYTPFEESIQNAK